jgi:hypothetical protein
MCFTAWKEPISRPNCSRCLAYSTAFSRQRSLAPSRSVGCDCFEAEFADAAGAVDRRQQLDRQTRGVPRDQSEALTRERHQEDVRGAGVHGEQQLAVEASTLEPDTGVLVDRQQLGRRYAHAGCAGGELRQPLGALLRGSRVHQGGGRHDRGSQERSGRHRPGEGLGGDRRVEQRQAAATVLLGNQDSRHTELGQPLPEWAVMPGWRLHDLAHARDRRLGFEIAPYALLEQPLLFRQSEIHQFRPFSNLGSRGMPSPRSLMMFFWI